MSHIEWRIAAFLLMVAGDGRCAHRRHAAVVAADLALENPQDAVLIEALPPIEPAFHRLVKLPEKTEAIELVGQRGAERCSGYNSKTRLTSLASASLTTKRLSLES